MILTYQDLDKVRREKYDPSDISSRDNYLRNYPPSMITTTIGIVENNSDPDGLGRLRVRLPLVSNALTPWIFQVQPFASKGYGTWFNPEIQDQVLVGFYLNNVNRPFVIATMFTPRHSPPVTAEEGNNIKGFYTKSGHRVEFNDEEGAESLTISTSEGQMRLELSKEKGLSLVNELGDINISCRKLIMESEDATLLQCNSSLTIGTGDALSIESSSGMDIVASGDAVLEGSKIDLKGSGGVTAEMKQIAKENDQVLGIDFHDIQVPSPSGLTLVPMIPHPYLGKLVDGLSQDVMISGSPAATKDSTSMFDTPGHIPMPPGVQFKKNPSNEGVVSSGTSTKVLINGKEAACLGSMVKTCSDPQDQETCTIVAAGAAVPLPIMLPGMDPDQFEQDGGTIFNVENPIADEAAAEASRQERSLSSPSWSVTSALIGEEVTMSVSTSNVPDMSVVHFTIWDQNADQETDSPEKKVWARVEGGQAEAKWVYSFQADPQNPLTEKPKFIFTAKCFKCESVESDAVEFSQKLCLTFIDIETNPMENIRCKITQADNSEVEAVSDSNGKIEQEDLIPGEYKIMIISEKSNG